MVAAVAVEVVEVVEVVVADVVAIVDVAGSAAEVRMGLGTVAAESSPVFFCGFTAASVGFSLVDLALLFPSCFGVCCSVLLSEGLAFCVVAAVVVVVVAVVFPPPSSSLLTLAFLVAVGAEELLPVVAVVVAAIELLVGVDTFAFFG